MAQETSGLTNLERDDKPAVRLGEPDTDLAGTTTETTSEETVKLHSQIEETRENLGETIDAIQERLSISNLSEQVSEQVSSAIETAKDTVYDATIGKAANFMKQAREGVMETSVGRTIMSNPIPFALIGAGSAMLIYNGFSKKGNGNRVSKYRTTDHAATRPGDGRTGSAGLLSGAGESISNKAGSAIDTVSQKASDTLSGATEMASRTYEKVGELGSSAKENISYYAEEKPLAMAAAAIAVGAAVGFAIPSTQYEGELMGDARENLMSKAEETATEFVDKAKQVAADATRSATQETGSQTGTARNP